MKKKKILDYFFNYFGNLETNYPSNPFGLKPIASKQDYLNLHNIAKKKSFKEIDDLEKKIGYKIEKEWIDNLALYTQIVIKKSDINYNHGRILYSILCNYLTSNNCQHVNIIETGTARGFSSLCMSKAINDCKSNGTIITFDILPHSKKMIWNSIDDTNQNGPISRRDILSRWPSELQNIIFIQGSARTHLLRTSIERCHFAFLDAEHTKKDVLNEFKFVSERQINGDIIVFDDVTPNTFDGVVEAIADIEKQGDYKINNILSSDKRGYAIATKISK